MSVASEPAPPSAHSNKEKRNIWMIALASILLLVGIGWLLFWLLIGRFYIYTEDAYVHGNEVMLTPQVTAGVKAIYADETDLVQQGQLIAELDYSNFEIRVEEWNEILANKVREVSALFQDVKAKEAAVALKTAQLRQAELDYKHREPLIKTGAVSKEEFETYETNVLVATSALVFAEKELEASRTLVMGTTIETHPRVQEAVWNLRQAYLDLIRCQIWSPVTGYIAKRTVQVGDQVKEGDTLLYIVPLDYIWVEANYKETQLKKARIGQPVHFTADLYGKQIKYHGKIIGFQPGSGNAFSLLPPENASGNWIKIIQRVPVRVSVDPEEIKTHPLFLGLSMRVTVDVHDLSGETLSVVPTCKPIYTTSIYHRQIEELAFLESYIQEVIKNNMQPAEK